MKIVPKQNLLFAGCSSGEVKAIDSSNQKLIFILKEHYSTITDLDYNDDQDTLITSSFDRTVTLWDLTNKKVIEKFGGFSNSIYAAKFAW